MREHTFPTNDKGLEGAYLHIGGKSFPIRSYDFSFVEGEYASIRAEAIYVDNYIPDLKTEMNFIATMTPEGSDYFKRLYFCDWAYGDDKSVSAHYKITGNKIEQIVPDDTTWYRRGDEMARLDREEEVYATACDGSYNSSLLAKKAIELDLDPKTKLLRKYNVVNLDGTLTNEGKNLVINMMFKDKDFQAKVVDRLDKLDTEEA